MNAFFNFLVADALRKNLDRENDDGFRLKKSTLRTCLIL